MLTAALWSAAGSMALVIGAAIAVRFVVPLRFTGLLLAFGGGALVSAIAFELTDEAFITGGTAPVVVGLALGGLVYHAGNRLLHRWGARHGMEGCGEAGGGRAALITLGVLLDGIPESLVIGLNQLRGTGGGLAFVAAVFLSGLPEALGAATGMRRSGRSVPAVLAIWIAVAATAVAAAPLAYAGLGGAPVGVVAAIRAFAAGAILVLLADVLMPEALEHGGVGVGLATVLGFAVSFFLTMLA